MYRLTAALLLAGSLGFQLWAQTPPSQQPAAQAAAAEQTPAAPVASTSASSEYPLDKFKEFSAIMIGGPAPGLEAPAHIYRSGNLMRMEANDGNSYQITDLVKQDTHGLAKTGCLAYDTPYIRTYPFSFSSPNNKFERVPVGKETVDGHVCQVEDIIVTLSKRPGQPRFRVWEAEDLEGFPVKIETKAHQTIQYKNVVLGPQDPTLFIFPTNCQVMNRKDKGASPATPKPKAAPAGSSKQ